MVSLVHKHANVMPVVFLGYLTPREPTVSNRFSIPMGADLRSYSNPSFVKKIFNEMSDDFNIDKS